MLRRESRRDLRDEIFRDVMERKVAAVITVEGGGVVAGVRRVVRRAKALGLDVETLVEDGASVRKGNLVARIMGNPKQIALAEDSLIGLLSKASGIATAARRAVNLSGGKIRVVSGGWKKLPSAIKGIIREAVVIGGANIRISDDPFVYLDKNYVKIFGGIKEALEAVAWMRGRLKVVQLKGEAGNLVEDAVEAVEAGADILMIDTGRLGDIDSVASRLRKLGLRDRVKIAYAGNVRLRDVKGLVEEDVDILDIGKEILDAPLLDMRLDVVGK